MDQPKQSKCWVEDYPHENGKYLNTCMFCKEPFFGHKRRVCCKECQSLPEHINKNKMENLIYKPKGKALEYIPDGYALNVYLGCSFNCTYCYNRRLSNHDRPRARKDYQLRLAAEKDRYSFSKVFLSFLSDPFQDIEKEYRHTWFTLLMFYALNVEPVILTKGFIEPQYWELFQMFDKFTFGHTLIFEDIGYGIKYEPDAGSLGLRKTQLQKAKKLGLTTWVSVEPVIDVDEAIKVVRSTYDYVDYYRVGAWNYDKRAKGLDYSRLVEELIVLDAESKIILKQSLKKYLPLNFGI